MAITYEHLHHAVKKGEGWKNRLKQYEAKLAESTEKIVRTLETGTGALVGGVIQGKSKDPKGPHFMHMPVDLGLGLVLNGLGYFEAAGEFSDHLNNFGDGFIAAYAAAAGYRMGDHWKQTGHLLGKGGASAALPPPTVASGDMTVDDLKQTLANLKQQAR